MQRNARVIPQNMDREGSGGVGTLYVYSATHGISQMLDPEYFVAVRNQLRAGDRIRIYQMFNADVFGDKNRVLAFADVIVVNSSREGVEFFVDREPTFVPQDEDEAVAAAASMKFVAGEAKWKGPNGKWAVVGDDGETILSGLEDKELAQRIAAGQAPLPG